LICAPSNAAVDNVIKKIIEEQFIDGNGGKYRASIVRVGTGYSSSVSNIALDHIVNQLISDGAKTKNLEETLLALKKELKRLQVEIENLQRRVRLIANASNYLLSRDWEIRIDEDNFKVKERVLFVNHKLKKVQLTCPPPPVGEEEQYPINEQPHYRSCMASLVKYIERHNDNHSKLSQYTLVQNASSNLDTSNYNQVSIELRQELATFLLDSTHIVMTTLGSAGSKTMEYVKKFSVIVIDEAAQCSEPSMLPALNLGSSHCVLVGDPQQLPATIFSMSGRETKYDRSMFQRLEEGGHSVNMLNIQYRMDPLISVFPRQIFYDGSLTDGQNVVASNYGGDLTQKIKISFRYFQPLTVLDLDSHEEREGTNLSNFDEAQLVVHLYSSLDQATDGLVKKSSVAVITPYMQQVAVIKRLFEEKYGLSYKRFIDVSTIDAFQGKEATVVILSCVRASSKGGGIGFLSDVQRMNVALTRAKHFLFVIARCRTILINPFWRDFVAHARKQRAIIRVLPNQNSMKSNGMKSGRRSNASIGKRFPDLRSIRPFYHDDGNFVASTSSHQMKV
jgi:senataxin